MGTHDDTKITRKAKKQANDNDIMSKSFELTLDRNHVANEDASGSQQEHVKLEVEKAKSRNKSENKMPKSKVEVDSHRAASSTITRHERDVSAKHGSSDKVHAESAESKVQRPTSKTRSANSRPASSAKSSSDAKTLPQKKNKPDDSVKRVTATGDKNGALFEELVSDGLKYKSSATSAGDDRKCLGQPGTCDSEMPSVFAENGTASDDQNQSTATSEKKSEPISETKMADDDVKKEVNDSVASRDMKTTPSSSTEKETKKSGVSETKKDTPDVNGTPVNMRQTTFSTVDLWLGVRCTF